MINSSKMLMIFGACVFSGQLPAFGEMTADEAITLISGNTVDGERRDGGVPGVDAPGKIENFATPFSLYLIAMELSGRRQAANQRLANGEYLTIPGYA